MTIPQNFEKKIENDVLQNQEVKTLSKIAKYQKEAANRQPSTIIWFVSWDQARYLHKLMLQIILTLVVRNLHKKGEKGNAFDYMCM